jgi:hypothetical protein
LLEELVNEIAVARNGSEATRQAMSRWSSRRPTEYALRGYSTPIGVAEWTTAITTALPEEFTASLPSIADLEAEPFEPPTE